MVVLAALTVSGVSAAVACPAQGRPTKVTEVHAGGAAVVGPWAPACTRAGAEVTWLLEGGLWGPCGAATEGCPLGACQIRAASIEVRQFGA